MRILMIVLMFLVPALMMHAAEQKATLKVSGNCSQCKKRIVKAAKSIDGVIEANWNKTTKVLSVEFDDTKASVDLITKAVLRAGHDVEDKRADQTAYNALPECCSYRDREH